MVLPGRRALIGIPASASPVDEVTLPLSSGVSSAARGEDGNKKAEAAANAIIANAAPVRSLAFIWLAFPVCFESRPIRVLTRLALRILRLLGASTKAQAARTSKIRA